MTYNGLKCDPLWILDFFKKNPSYTIDKKLIILYIILVTDENFKIKKGNFENFKFLKCWGLKFIRSIQISKLRSV